MCLGIQEMIQEGKREGRAEGRAEGRTEGRTEGLQRGIEGAVELLREAGFEDRFIVERIMAKFQLSLEDAEGYVLLDS